MQLLPETAPQLWQVDLRSQRLAILVHGGRADLVHGEIRTAIEDAGQRDQYRYSEKHQSFHLRSLGSLATRCA
ncbi:hypothetical protein D3C81_1910340 [compost metagenome]